MLGRCVIVFNRWACNVILCDGWVSKDCLFFPQGSSRLLAGPLPPQGQGLQRFRKGWCTNLTLFGLCVGKC